MNKKLLIMPVLAAVLFVGVVSAKESDLPKPGLLPGSAFYFLDSAFEGFGTLFAFGDVAKAKRHLALAEERLAEAKALAEKGDGSRAERSTQKYESQINKALDKAKRAKENGKDTDEVLAKVAEVTLRHQEVLAEVYDRVPEQAKEAIQRAMENSLKGHDTALEAVSGERQNEIRSQVETNTKDVQERLNELRDNGAPIPENVSSVSETLTNLEILANLGLDWQTVQALIPFRPTYHNQAENARGIWRNPSAVQFIGKDNILFRFEDDNRVFSAVLSFSGDTFNILEIFEDQGNFTLSDWQNVVKKYGDPNYAVGTYTIDIVRNGEGIFFNKLTKVPENIFLKDYWTASQINTSKQSQGVASSEATVTYTANGFEPNTVTIKKGGNVTWTRQSSGGMWVASAAHPSHVVYSGTSLGDHCPDVSGTAFDECGSGNEYVFTFTKVGTWKYHNHLDASKFGTVIVTE